MLVESDAGMHEREHEQESRAAAPAAAATPAAQGVTRLQQAIGNRAATRVLSRLKIGGAPVGDVQLATQLSSVFGPGSYERLKTELASLKDADYATREALEEDLVKRGMTRAAAPAPSAPAPKGPSLEERRKAGRAKVDAIYGPLEGARINITGPRALAHVEGEDGSDGKARLTWGEVTRWIRSASRAQIEYQEVEPRTGRDVFRIEYDPRARPPLSIVFETRDGRDVWVRHVGPSARY